MTLQREPDYLLNFHRTGPMPCPYLDGHVEQQLFTELSGTRAQDVFEQLSAGGFRRSHHIAYKPACRGCAACVPVRIVADRFEMSQSWRRILRRNSDVTAQLRGKQITDEQYRLFRRYVAARHADGDMARMNRRDYAAMVVSSPVETELVEFRTEDGRMIAACIMDQMRDGLSAVYSFFDPAEAKRSLGSYMVLWMVKAARARNLDHVYLGFWIKDSSKMTYKRRFRPLEGFGPMGWAALD